MFWMAAIFTIATLISSQAHCADQILDFWVAKRVLKGNPPAKTFYCGCPIYKTEHGLRPDLTHCSYAPPGKQKGPQDRAYRIEYEHIMPAAQFGHTRPCWKQDLDHDGHWDGRKACEKRDPLFRRMEGDINNLVPVIGLLNARRSDYAYGMVKGEPRAFGQCDFEIGARTAEPRPVIRGDIARTMFYMGHTYGIRLPDSELNILLKWNEEDPISPEEYARSNKIVSLGGRPNPYVLGAFDHLR